MKRINNKPWHGRLARAFWYTGKMPVLRRAARWAVIALAMIALARLSADAADPSTPAKSPEVGTPAASAALVPDSKQVGGEPDGIVQVANLVYATNKSSHCFSDYFLIKAEKETAISTSRRFHAVKLASEELFGFPLVIMTGEGGFQLTDAERENFVNYVRRGGMVLASASCSSKDWEQSFRKEMALMFPEEPLETIGMDHPIFHTVYDIHELQAGHRQPQPLEGVTIGGRLGVIYSQDGLNDTSHTEGCCCCGGNEIGNAIDINVNILAYALTY